jgi:hypothetical protein
MDCFVRNSPRFLYVTAHSIETRRSMRSAAEATVSTTRLQCANVHRERNIYMITLTRGTWWATLMVGFCLTGCDQHDTAREDTSASHARSEAAAESTSGTDNPCALLTDSEVREVFGEAASGQRDHSVDHYGIRSCVWETHNDRFVVQTFTAESGTAEDELRGRVQGGIDPTMAGAAQRVRYEPVAGIGDNAMMVAEAANAQYGIFTDMAILVTRRGDRGVVLFSGLAFAGGDRGKALTALEQLGRSAARRF